jgi:hypothetical protein
LIAYELARGFAGRFSSGSLKLSIVAAFVLAAGDKYTRGDISSQPPIADELGDGGLGLQVTGQVRGVPQDVWA